MLRFPKTLRTFAKQVEGGMTLLGLYLFGAMIIVGALALDVSNLIAVRTQLQAAADFAAHAALYERQYTNDPAVAKARALALVQQTYPVVRYGNMLKPEDINFGHYNPTNYGFQVDESSDEAAVAFTGRNEANANPVTAYLSRMIGYDTWNVATSSVFTAVRAKCLTDGWIGQDVVDGQSNNNFVDGFCIHSNTEVQFNSNNTYDCADDVTVSAPGGESGVNLPTSGYDTNAGIECSINKLGMFIPLTILSDRNLAKIRAGLTDPTSEYFRPFLDPDIALPITLPSKMVSPEDFTVPGAVYTFECSGPNQKLTINADAAPLIGVMIETNCKIDFSQDSVLEDVVIWSTNTIDKAVVGSKLTLGRDDNCADGGGVIIMTLGGFEVSNGLSMFGSQILARGSIQFAAGPRSEGVSMVSWETVNATSTGAQWDTCLNSATEVWSVPILRMAG